VSKTSSNLKGTYQKSLKLAAGKTLDIEVLRTRADRSAEEHNSAEIVRLREEMEKNQRSMEEQIRELKGSLEKARSAKTTERQKAETERKKAEAHLNLLRETNREKEELRQQLRVIKEEQDRWWGATPMKTEEDLPKGLTPKRKRSWLTRPKHRRKNKAKKENMKNRRL